jgi:hypothetical protein
MLLCQQNSRHVSGEAPLILYVARTHNYSFSDGGSGRDGYNNLFSGGQASFFD